MFWSFQGVEIRPYATDMHEQPSILDKLRFYLQYGAQFSERFQVVDVNDERSQQIVEVEAERLQEGVEEGRFHRKEIEEELIFVLTHVDEEGTAGTHQRAVIA